MRTASLKAPAQTSVQTALTAASRRAIATLLVAQLAFRLHLDSLMLNHPLEVSEPVQL